ncbi:DUF535 family protein [Pseudoduganella sp. R-34]|uniref:DUF535 family protein n=1 Tax=Pseudoduganella sp. R-34 TaxID=3404062 RepID=UPI003CF7BFCA
MNKLNNRPTTDDSWAEFTGLLLLLLAAAYFAAWSRLGHISGVLPRFDLRVAYWLTQHTAPWLTPLLRTLSHVNSGPAIALLSLPLALHFLLRGRRAWLAALLLGLALIKPAGGATAMTILLIGIGGTYLAGRRPPNWQRAAVAGFALLLIALVAVSRVCVGAQYPSEVLSALCVSGAWLGVCLVSGACAMRMRPQERPTRTVGLRTAVTGKMGLSRLCALLKLELRCLPTPRLMRRWLDLLNDYPMREFALTSPHLVQKPFRPWFSRRLDRAARLQALAGHYRIICNHGLAPLLIKAASKPVTLVRFVGKDETPYAIELCAVAVMEREGELALRLRSAQGPVYTVAFSFLRDNGQTCVAIGCAQGPAADGLELVRSATRNLYGLRPRDLLLRLVQQFGLVLECEQLRLVGNDNRTVARGSVRRGRIKADYDSMWREMGARGRADGDFELPCLPLPALHLESVPSKKRAEARRRHQLLQALNDAALARLFPANKRLSAA